MITSSWDRSRRVTAVATVLTVLVLAAGVVLAAWSAGVPEAWWPHTGQAFTPDARRAGQDACAHIWGPAKACCKHGTTVSTTGDTGHHDVGGAVWRLVPVGRACRRSSCGAAAALPGRGADMLRTDGCAQLTRYGKKPLVRSLLRDLGTPRWPDQCAQRTSSPDHSDLRKRPLPFLQFSVENPAGQPAGATPPRIDAQRILRPPLSVHGTAHLGEDGVDLPHVSQDTGIEIPLLHQDISQAKGMVEVQGDLIGHHVVRSQPGDLRLGIGRQHGQRLDQQAPAERGIRTVHCMMVARVLLSKPTDGRPAEPLHPWSVGHVHEYAGTSGPGRC